MHDLHLVACVKAKAPEARIARDLYISPWFAKARRYVERQGAPWMILSAQHGLVDPEEVLEPYDLTLRDLDAAERARWGSRVAHQLRDLCGDPIPPVVFLAGLPYRAALTPHLPRYRVPMYGLGIGEQLAWLDRNTA